MEIQGNSWKVGNKSADSCRLHAQWTVKAGQRPFWNTHCIAGIWSVPLSFDFIGIVDTFLKNGMVPCDLLKTGLNAWSTHNNDISFHAID